MKNIKIVIVALVVLVAIFVGAKFFYEESEVKRVQNLSQKDGAPFIRNHSMKLGKNSSNITVVEFFDPLCGACAAFHPITKRVFNEYENEIELVVRYLANHPSSIYMVRVIEASRKQQKFQEVLDTVLNTQRLWIVNNEPKPKMIWQYLSQVKGLNIEQLRQDFESLDVSEILRQDIADARTLGVRGTPSFFVNGKKLESLTHAGLLDLVELELYK